MSKIKMKKSKFQILLLTLAAALISNVALQSSFAMQDGNNTLYSNLKETGNKTEDIQGTENNMVVTTESNNNTFNTLKEEAEINANVQNNNNINNNINKINNELSGVAPSSSGNLNKINLNSGSGINKVDTHIDEKALSSKNDLNKEKFSSNGYQNNIFIEVIDKDTSNIKKIKERTYPYEIYEDVGIKSKLNEENIELDEKKMDAFVEKVWKIIEYYKAMRKNEMNKTERVSNLDELINLYIREPMKFIFDYFDPGSSAYSNKTKKNPTGYEFDELNPMFNGNMYPRTLGTVNYERLNEELKSRKFDKRYFKTYQDSAMLKELITKCIKLHTGIVECLKEVNPETLKKLQNDDAKKKTFYSSGIGTDFVDGFPFEKFKEKPNQVFAGSASVRAVVKFGMDRADEYVDFVFEKISDKKFIRKVLDEFMSKRKAYNTKKVIPVVEVIDYLFKKAAWEIYKVGLQTFDVEFGDTKEKVESNMYKLLINNEYDLCLQKNQLYDYISAGSWKNCATAFPNFEQLMLHIYGSELGPVLRVIDKEQQDEEDLKKYTTKQEDLYKATREAYRKAFSFMVEYILDNFKHFFSKTAGDWYCTDYMDME